MCRHQAGWFPFNLDNEMQLPGERANPDDPDGEPRHEDLQEMASGSHSVFSVSNTWWHQHIGFCGSSSSRSDLLILCDVNSRSPDRTGRWTTARTTTGKVGRKGRKIPTAPPRPASCPPRGRSSSPSSCRSYQRGRQTLLTEPTEGRRRLVEETGPGSSAVCSSPTTPSLTPALRCVTTYLRL